MNKLLPQVLYFCLCSFVIGSPAFKTGGELVEGITFIQECLNTPEVVAATEMVDINLRSVAWSFVSPVFLQGILNRVQRGCGGNIQQCKGICMMAALAISSGRSAYSAAQVFSDSTLFALCAAFGCGASAAIAGYFIKDITHTTRRTERGIVQKKLSHMLRHEVYMVNFWHWSCLINKIIGREEAPLDYFAAMVIHYFWGPEVMGVCFTSGLYLLGRRYLGKRIGVFAMALISAVVGYYFYFITESDQARADAAFDAVHVE
jgi:hypothetical protein